MLKIRENEKIYKAWLIANTAAVFGLFVYFSLYNFATNYFGRLYYVGYILVPLICVPCFLLFRGLKDGWEIRLYFLFCLLITVFRAVAGSLAEEINLIITLGCWMCLCHLTAASLLPEELSLKILDTVSVIVCAAYSLLGILGIYTGVSGQSLMHPLTGLPLCHLVGSRLFIFNSNCNSVAGWFYMTIMLCIFLFFRKKKKWQRCLSLLGIVIMFLCISITFSRSIWLSFSVSMGMLTACIALDKMADKQLWKKALVLVVLMLAVIPLTFKAFSVAGEFVVSFSEMKTEVSTVNESAEGSALPQAAASTNTELAKDLNERGMSSTGRTDIWKASLECLKEDPERIIFGSLLSIDETNQYIMEHYPEVYKLYGEKSNHHNTYLELLQENGIINFLLMMVFFVLLLIKMIKLYFSQHTVPAVKIIVIAVSGLMLYNCVESTLFTIYDMRTAIFCVLAGYVLAFAKKLKRTKA